MLNIDSIRDKLLSDARRDAARIISDADVRAQQARAASEARIADARAKAQLDVDAQAEEARSRMLRMAELDMRKALLAAKREAIDEAFCRALERMRAMDTAAARDFAARTMLESAEGTEEIVFDARDERVYTPGFVESVNAALKASGRPGRLTISAQRRAINGGFILKSGGAETVCTYEALLSQARGALEGDVMRLLFPGS